MSKYNIAEFSVSISLWYIFDFYFISIDEMDAIIVQVYSNLSWVLWISQHDCMIIVHEFIKWTNEYGEHLV